MHLVRFAHFCRLHSNMDNEIQGSPVTLAQVDKAQGGRVEGTHPESDLELLGTPTTHHHFARFTCTGVQNHGFCFARACDPIHWDTHRGEDKE